MKKDYDGALPLLDTENVLQLIPHKPPFRYVDTITNLSKTYCEAEYHFKEREFFYEGHFPDFKITPSVILTECMAQCGLLPLGIVNYLNENGVQKSMNWYPIFTNSEVKFTHPVLPNTKVFVYAELVFFRMNRVKSKVNLKNEDGKLCASGLLSGVIQVKQ
jgi:3-hydroxyacyl-[acyl-carrier-protein] dehydratase